MSSAEEVEAIVRRVMADVLAKQQSGAASRTSSGTGEMLNLEDYEIPDDLGSIFTAVTLPNELKDSLGKVEKNDGLAVSETVLIRHDSPPRHLIDMIDTTIHLRRHRHRTTPTRFLIVYATKQVKGSEISNRSLLYPTQAKIWPWRRLSVSNPK